MNGYAMMIAALRRDASGAAPYGILWLLVFAFAATVAVVVQFVVLGWLFPEWSDGAGLLLNTDSVTYHRLAADLAGTISEDGWQNWELSPEGQFPIGFFGAVYALTVAKPWAAIPLNAIAHAFSAILIMRIARLVTDDWRVAALAALPYAVFPTASLWYSQLLKDGYFNLGVLVFCYGWMRIASEPAAGRVWRPLALALLLILIGYWIAGLVRPYALTLMFWTAAAMTILLLGRLAYRAARGTVTPRDALVRAVVLGLCLFLLGQSGAEATARGIVSVDRVELSSRNLYERYAGTTLFDVDSGKTFDTDTSNKTFDTDTSKTQNYWRRSPWLPKIIDRRLATVAGVRGGFLSSRGLTRSMIDRGTEFHRAFDILAYMPRALQIAFLAPFPNQWLEPGSTRATTIMRRVSMFEMTVIYGALLFVPLALWRMRRRPEMWVAVVFCGSMLLVFALSIPVVGALYRFRYAYLMVFVAFGVVGAANWWRGRRVCE